MTCVEGSTTAGIANWVQCTSLTVPKPNYNLTGKPSAKRFNNGDLKKSFDTNQSSFDSYYSGYFVNDADKYSELNDGWWVANWQTEITLIQNPFHVIRPVGTQATLETVAYGPSLKYQWYVATSAAGTGTQISSATNSTYAATVQSANRWYYCVISGTDSKGVAMSKTSARALVGPGETPVIDDTPPTGTISASTTCTNQNSVTLYVKAQDAISGVNNVNIVAWTGGEAYDKTCSTKAATYNSTKQQWEVTYTFTEIKNTTTGATNQGDNSYYFKGHIFDGAGNRAVTSAATVMYDTTAPTYGSYTVTGTTLTNGIRYAPSSTSEITLKFTALSDNLSGVKNIDAYMKKDGATRSNAYTVSSSISGTTGEVRFKLNGYGTYVTEMYLYDKAGNSKVLPAITIEVEQGDPLPKLMERDMYNYDDPEPSMIGARRADENTTYLAEKVLHIRFINLAEASEPTNYVATWDASYNDGEGEVTAWVVQSYEDSSMYDLIIGADDIIQAPENSECLFAYYENCISIEGLENLSTSNVTTMSHMFDGCGILGLNLNYFDTTNVQSMSCMFLNCQDIVELDLGSFNTSAVTDMSSMFCECRSLEYVNVSSFDTSKVTNMFSMFKCCYLLEDINITNFDTSLVVNIQEMFRQCSSLETVDLSHFATGYVQRMDYLFQDCTSLKYIDLSTQNFSAADPSTGMFQGCGNLESIKIGPIFCTLNWKYAFEDCTSLKAIISTSESPLFLVTTGNLQSLPNAILYVPSTTAEAAYEAADNYDTVFGADRVRPILELVGDSTVKVFTGSTYKDAGITVAGMDKDTVNSTYTPYGYTVSGPVIKKNGTVVSSIDTSTAGNTYTYTYTIKDSTNTEGMSVTRTVTVANPGRLMARESGISGTESYAIGAKRAGKTQYTADKIKTITLQGNLTAPKGYVDTWDVSENQDGSLAAWVVKNSEDSTMYDLYIGGNNEIKAPTAGYMLFAFYTKCTKINNLNLLNTSSTTGMRGFFYRLYELESLDLSNFSTASCTNTWDMFSDCKALTTLDVSNFDTSKLNYATYMFYGCMNVTNINLGNFVTTNVTSTSGMFYNCQKLTSVDVSTFDTSKVTNMSRMFSNCYALKNLNLKNFDTSKVTNMSFMFSSTTSLLNLDLSSFNTTSVTNMDSMLFNSSNLLSLLIGNNFDKLTGASMFRSCSKLKRIITPRTSISTLNADSTTTTGLKTLTNVILYVPTLDAETTYESNAAYSDIFGSARIKPILELIGNNPRTIYQNMPYTDDGVTVAELYKNLDDTYTPFGYTVSVPVIRKNGTIVSEVDTSTLETYTLTYTVVDPSGVSGMSVTRTLTPGSKPVLMARDSDANGYYAIGAVRTAYDIADDMYLDYRADTIKTITLVDLSTTAAPTNYEATWDAGYDYGSNAVIAYIKANAEDSTMYDLYLCSYGTMYAPADSKTLFAYYTNCTNINNLELLDTSDATTMRGFFYKMESLQSVELSEFSTTNCTNMWDMFNNCKSLTSISVSSFDTSNLIYATWMFYGCSNVTNINLAGIDTTNVKSMSGMFYNCSKLASLDLSSFNTANVTDMGTMFRNCSTLKSLDLTSFNTSSVTNMDQMFSTCSNLTSMKLGANFDKLIGATMFTGCSNLKAIITPRTTILTLNDDTTTNTGLKTLANAILYVPSTTAETTFEAATSYADIFGASRIKPILELIGDNPVKASNGVTYVDSGVTVAGMTKNADGTTYTPYGYTVSGPVIKKDGTVVSNIDTSTKGTYTYTYTVKDSVNAEGMRVTRNVIVKDNPTLMERDFKEGSSYTFYAMGAYRTDNNTTYTADKIKTITLLNLLESPTPKDYVATWDASYTNGDGDVTAWLVTNASDSTMYDLYLGAEGKIYAPSNSHELFSNYNKCIAINGLNNLDTTKVTTMAGMFSLCGIITELDVSNFNTSNVNNMGWMFYECSSLTKLDVSHFNTSNVVTDMNRMFYNCSSLVELDVSNFDTGKVTAMSSMFYNCNSLHQIDVSHFNTSQVTTMAYMFSNCSSLVELDVSNFDTGKVTTMAGMFYNCSGITRLDVSNFKTSNVESMQSMFYKCNQLTELDLSRFDTGSVTNTKWMFSNCNSLTKLDLSNFVMTNVNDMNYMFNNCESLKSLRLGEKFEQLIGVGMFVNCSSLKAIITSRTTIMTLNDNETTVTDLKTLINAILYVPSTTAEATFEADANYADIFGADRIRPILELVGENPVKVSKGATYVDNGVTVAGMTKNADGTTYTPYGYTVSGPVIKKDGTVVSNIDTSAKGTYTYTYTIKDSPNTEGMSVTRDVIVKDNPTLMVRNDYNSTYIIGSNRAESGSNYTADKVKKITLIDLSTTMAPTTYEATWDASYTNGDGDVTAWLVTNTEDSAMYDLYLGAEGKIYAPSDSTSLFRNYGNCVEINELNNLITKQVTNMSYMFSGCSSLTKLDLSSFDTSNVINMSHMIICSGLTNLNISSFDTRNVTDMSYMFSCKSLTTLNVSNFDTSNVTNMEHMFGNCSGLTNLDLSGFNTSNVTNMISMFYSCSSLTNLDLNNFDTKNVTNMRYMFSTCTRLKNVDLSNLDTRNLTSMRNMFYSCSSLTSLDLSNFNTSNVIDMYGVFDSCSNLTSLNISGFDTKNVTDMTYMFNSCKRLTSLDVSVFNTNKVTRMKEMFSSCSSLINLDLSSFDTSNVTDMTYMFLGCSSLTNLDLSNFDTSNVIDMSGMFSSCSSLKDVDVSSFNTSSVTSMYSMFYKCSSLTNLDVSNFDTSDVTMMFQSCSSLISLRLGQNFNKLTGAYMFSGCSNLKAIITPRTTIMTLNDDTTTNTGLKTLPNAILYVPSTTAEATFEADANYADIFGADRIKPILELVGENPVKVSKGATYVDSGVTVAGMTKNADGTTYTPYGYTVSGPVIKKDGTVVSSIDTNTKGTYTYTYTIKDSASVEGMSVTRDVIVKDNPTLMRRERKYDSSTNTTTYYAIGSYERLGTETYTSDKIKKITLIDLSTESAPATYVATWDASYTNGDGGVTAWIVANAEDSTMYDLYLGAEGKIYAPSYSYGLFCDYKNCIEIEGLNNLNTSKVTDMQYMFNKCSSLTSLNVSGFDTSIVTNMCSMFDSCSSLISLDVSHFDTSKVTDMFYMFHSCSKLSNLDVSELDTSNVTRMNSMFGSCTSLTNLDVSSFDTGKVTDMSFMFYESSSLSSLDVSNFNTSKVTDMNAMFYSCSSLTNLDISNFDTSKVTNMSFMFSGCSSLPSLDISNFNTSKVTNMNAMFQSCSSLPSLDVNNFDTQNVTNMSYMFSGCSGLTNLDVSGFDTSNIMDMSYMFRLCNNLISLKLGQNFDKLTGANMFNYCSKLKAIITPCTTIMTLNDNTTTNTGLKTLTNAILYVPSTTAEATFEADANYADIFGADRIRPILELVGDNPVKVSKGATYVDSGVTVAGMTKNADGTTYTPYGYTVSGPVIKKDGTIVSNIDTSTKGNYTYTYTVKDSSNVEGMSVTRDVIVKDNPTLMRRDYNGSTYYAIGAYRADNSTTYTADKIKKITLIDLSSESAPTTYVATWDASYTNGDGDVTAWLVTNAEDSTMYDLYLGAEGKIYAPSNSDELFYNYKNCIEIKGLKNLDTINVTDMRRMFNNCNSLANLDVSNFNTSKVTSMSSMFNNCSSLKNLDVSKFDTSNVTNVGSMFDSCSNLTNLDVSGFDTSKVTSMYKMFYYCNNLTNLDVSGFDTSNVTDVSQMFERCSSLTNLDVSNFNTSKVTSMNSMFSSCSSLKNLDVSKFDTSNVTNIGSMFDSCSNLTNLDVSGFDTSNVTSMYRTFSYCNNLTNLDVSGFDTSNVTNMYMMFTSSSSLTKLDVSGFNTSKVTSMRQMFYSCGSLISLDVSGFDTSKVTDMTYMFASCGNLTSLKLGLNFDKLNGEEMFAYCSNLKAIITPRTTIMTLNDNTTTNTGLKTLTNAILYVPSTTAEATFEADANYADIFGADRIKPILELVSDNPVKVSKGATYVDSGVTVAGMTKNADGTTYTPYGYTVSGPVIKKDGTVVSSVDTSNVGTYTLTYTVHEPNSSVDGMSVTREVEIESKDISENNPDITVSIPTEDRVYKDAEYKPVVTIKDNAKTLVENTDYTVSYSNNINAGMATITIKGINNYTGTRTINFIITQRAVTIKPKDASKVYDTLPLTSNVAEVTAGDLVTGHTATITTTGSITEVGSITNTISTLIIKNASGTDVTENYDITEGVGTLTVTAAYNVDFDITLDNNTFVYDGTEKEPGVTIKVDGVTLEEGKDYDVSYKNNIKAGTATVTIKGKGNYEGSSSTKDFTITVRLLEITAGSASKVYNGTALTSSAFSITSGTSLAPNQTLSVTTSGTITNVGTTSNVIATYGIYHSGEDVKSNYNVTLKEGTLEVKPATITGSVTITGTNRVGKTLTAEVTVDPNDASLTYAWYYGTTNDINNATAIAGANTKTYSPTTDKIGMYIFVKVTASKANYDSATFTDITDNENNKVEKVGDRLTPYLMAREVQTVTSNGVTSEKAGYAIGAYRAGKTKYTSDLIKSVTIINLLETNAPTTYEAMWDASRDEDEAVYAWAVKNQTNSSMYDLYIGGEGTLVLTNGKRLFADYTKCDNITGLNKMNSTNVTDMSYMFSNLANMSTLDVSVVNTSSVTNTEGMFMTNNLTTLNVSGFDTGKVTNMSKMFKESSNLTSLNINGFNTANTNNMSQMFMDCGNITSLNVSAFNTSNVTNMSAMFMGMSKLESINVTNFNTANVTDMSSMFASCTKIQRLDLHTFNTAKVTNISGMFTADSSMKSVLLGEEFNKLNGSNMFTGCSSLKAIIAQKKITASSEAMTLSATGTGLNTLTNATLYVPNLESKGYYETATNYATVFGEARVKPILEIIGSNPVYVTVGKEYVDQGAKVAGFEESEATEYTVYGYTLSVSGLPVDTSTAGTRLVIYTVKYKDQIVVTGATW